VSFLISTAGMSVCLKNSHNPKKTTPQDHPISSTEKSYHLSQTTPYRRFAPRVKPRWCIVPVRCAANGAVLCGIAVSYKLTLVQGGMCEKIQRKDAEEI